MSLSKVTYVDGQTIIGAANLNAIQDEIIANGNAIGTQATAIQNLGTNKADVTALNAEASARAEADTAIEGELDDLKSAFDELFPNQQTIDFSTATVIDGVINTSNQWSVADTYESYAFNVSPEVDEIVVTAKSAIRANVALLKSNALVSGQTPPYATGITGDLAVAAGATQTIAVPEDCTYIVIRKTAGVNDFTPDEAIIRAKGKIPAVDSTLTIAGDAADAKTVGEKVFGIMPASAIPWEIGGVTNAGLSGDWTRGRMGVTIRTITPVTIKTTAEIASYVYDLSGTRLTDESNTSWSTASRTIKADRLFRLATRKNSSNPELSPADLALLVSGIAFIFPGYGAEVVAASQDADGNRFPTIGAAITGVQDAVSYQDDLDYTLIATLKQAAFINTSGVSALESLAESLTRTVATVYAFSPRIRPWPSAGGGYKNQGTKNMTTQRLYFDCDGRYRYKIKAVLNTSAKAWVKLRYYNATALAAIASGANIATGTYTDVDFAEMVNGEFEFSPSGVTVGDLPVAGVAFTFGFGATAAADDVSIVGLEMESFKLERTVIVNG